RDGRPLSDGTVRRIHGVLHRAFAQAVRWEWMWINPAENASPPIAEHREIHSPPPGAVARMLALVQRDPAAEAYLRRSVVTGARRGGLGGLRWSDVDLRRGSVGFARAIAEGPDGLVVVPTKNRRTHRADVDGATVDALRSHRREVLDRAVAAQVTLVRD